MPPSAEKIVERHQQGAFKAETLLTQEKQFFAQAEAADTIAAYDEYLNRYPEGLFADKARLKQEILHLRQAEAADTAAAYGEYLKRYPQGGFAAEARARMEKLSAPVQTASEWGTVMYPKSNTNIRAARSVTSPKQGRLKAGQTVKADFLQDGWYAVFPVTQEERDEKKALGYVYAPLLIEKEDPEPFGPKVAGKESTRAVLPKKTETEGQPVGVKNIGFKVTGDGKELLLIEFDRFYTPVIFGVEGKEPMIILEIKNVALLKEEWAAIHTGGHYIKQIRSSMQPQTRAALVVLTMAPEKDYSVKQVFYNKENMYTLEISEKK